MKHVQAMLEAVTGRLKALAQRNAVVAKPISVGDRHVLTLCELSIGFGGAGGAGEGEESSHGGGKGTGGGAGGKAAACPVAVLIVEDGKVRLEHLGT
ncbi:MAG: spore germination protein GerW family protein [Bradymonadia bacterium]